MLGLLASVLIQGDFTAIPKQNYPTCQYGRATVLPFSDDRLVGIHSQIEDIKPTGTICRLPVGNYNSSLAIQWQRPVDDYQGSILDNTLRQILSPLDRHRDLFVDLAPRP